MTSGDNYVALPDFYLVAFLKDDALKNKIQHLSVCCFCCAPASLHS